MPNHLQDDDRIQFLDDASAMIAWLKDHPDVPLHRYATLNLAIYDTWVEDSEWNCELGKYVVTEREFTPASVARAMGKADKTTLEHAEMYELSRTFGAHRFRYLFDRNDVCEAKITGTETVTKKVAVDQDKIDELQSQIDALHTFVAVEQPVIEYVCPPSILAKEA